MLRAEILLNSQREIRFPVDLLADWRALRRRAVETAEFAETIPHYIVLRWANKEGFIDSWAETCAAEIIFYIFNRACPTNPTHILGIGNSGISLATAVHNNFEMTELVIARKTEQGPVSSNNYLLTTAFSYSQKRQQSFQVPKLPKDSRVLMIDDVVAHGSVSLAVGEAIKGQKGVEVVGFGVYFDKVFQGGLEKVSQRLGIPIFSLIRIAQIDPQQRELVLLEEKQALQLSL